MNAELRSITTPEGDGIDTVTVMHPFSIDLVLEIGIAGSLGADLFSLSVCSFDWIGGQSMPMFVQYTLIVDRFDAHEVEEIVRSRVAKVSGEKSADVFASLSRLARWEFENMSPPRRRDDT